MILFAPTLGVSAAPVLGSAVPSSSLQYQSDVVGASNSVIASESSYQISTPALTETPAFQTGLMEYSSRPSNVRPIEPFSGKTYTENVCFFCDSLSDAIEKEAKEFNFVLKVKVGQKGEFVLPLRKGELVFYSSTLQSFHKGRDVLLSVDRLQKTWCFQCSVDDGKTTLYKRFYDPSSAKLFMPKKRSDSLFTFYDRLDEERRVRFMGITIGFNSNWHVQAPVRIITDRERNIVEIRMRDRGPAADFISFKDGDETKYIYVTNGVSVSRILDFKGEVSPPCELRLSAHNTLCFMFMDQNTVSAKDMQELGLREGDMVYPLVENGIVVGFRPVNSVKTVHYVKVRDLDGNLLSANRRTVTSEHMTGVRILENLPSILISNTVRGRKYYYEALMLKKAPDVKSKEFFLRRIGDVKNFRSKTYSVAIDYEAHQVMMVKLGSFNDDDIKRIRTFQFVGTEFIFNDGIGSKDLTSELSVIPENAFFEIFMRKKLVEIVPQFLKTLENVQDVSHKQLTLKELLLRYKDDVKALAAIMYFFEKKSNLSWCSPLKELFPKILRDVVDENNILQAYLWLMRFNDSRRSAELLLERDFFMRSKVKRASRLTGAVG